MRILGIDYGDTRTGVAISDPTGLIATGLDTIIAYNDETILAQIQKIIENYDIKKIILGYPKNMNGSLGFRAEKASAFREKLKQTFNSIDVILWDERLTTVSAHRTLNEANFNSKKRKKVIDKMAACLILQNYLDSFH